MAKGKDMSKKAKDASKSKMVVDKTFGMKNKNKSKKVQKFVQQVQHAAQEKFTDKKAVKAQNEKMSRKEAKKAHDAEMALLFNVVEDKKPKKGKKEEEAAPAEAEEEEDNTEAWLAEMGIEAPEVDGRRKQARARRSAEANAAEENRQRKIAERDGKSIEEKLEIVRKGLQLDAPVNKDTFVEWKLARDAKRKSDLEAATAKAKKNTKKGGKSQLTGRQLFEFHSDLFVDDAEAQGQDDYAKEFDDAETAKAVIEGGAVPEGADAEAAEVVANVTEAAPANLEGVDESVFLAEDLDGLDDLPSDDDE
eukprot:TRINITY_DN10572_c0_g6_i1.p1 TRINITY_DN10572_c0_g6~~TRINITY_DN10572_c0_g6_i1.p1  ORF type:complete len:307 (-),score=120.73 TRINITY_DN10572_c0_g6_i1:103-1023(-)